MQVSAKVDYALRAALELAARADDDGLATTESLATAQAIPRQFLATILGELRRSGLVESKRGVDGGHRLAKAPSEIALGDVIRAVDGPLAAVSGVSPDRLEYEGVAAPMREVWVAVRASLRSVLDATTLADVAGRELPPVIGELVAQPGAWSRR